MHTTKLTRPAAAGLFTIGKLAEHTGCNVPTIRYYEEIGLLPPPKRSASGQRLYNGVSIALLLFIRQCRELGFSIEHIRTLVALSSDAEEDCGAVREIAQKRLDVVRAKLLELQALEQSLSRFVGNCASRCAEGPAPQCSIFDDIGDPGAARPDPGCCA